MTRLGPMAIRRMDNVGVVVDDLEAAIAFFLDLGWSWKPRLRSRDVGGRRRRAGRCPSRIAMVRTPDGHSRLELTKFHTPAGSQRRAERGGQHARHTSHQFAVDNIGDVVARLQLMTRLVGELAQYEDSYRLCYVRARRASSSRWPSSCADEHVLLAGIDDGGGTPVRGADVSHRPRGTGILHRDPIFRHSA